MTWYYLMPVIFILGIIGIALDEQNGPKHDGCEQSRSGLVDLDLLFESNADDP